MSQARDFADSFSAVSTGRRNLIINGAMQVAQRGTSFTGADSEYTLDRYRLNSANEDEFVCDVSQSTDAPDGFTNSMKVDVTTAETTIDADERISIEQRIEAQNLQHLEYGTANAKTTTLSMWVKSSVTGKYGVNIRAHDANDNYNASFTINTADTWEHKTMTIDGNTLSGGEITNDTGIGLWFRLMLVCGSNHRTSTVDQWVADNSKNAPSDAQTTWGTSTSHEFYLTGVQWELGNSASPFEHRSYGEELALCQRYYHQTDLAAYQRYDSSAYADTTSRVYTTPSLPETMRATPTITQSGLTVDGAAVDSVATPLGTQKMSFKLNHDSSRTANESYQVYPTGTASVKFDAEL